MVELDGSVHDSQQGYDKFRETLINTMGIKVIRFNNDEIENNLSELLEKLKETQPPAPSLFKEKGSKRSKLVCTTFPVPSLMLERVRVS